VTASALLTPTYIWVSYTANQIAYGSGKLDQLVQNALNNGDHTGPNHLNATAVDINRINGDRMATTGVTNQITELQKSFDNFAYIRENFGPHFKHKFSKEKPIGSQWDYNYPTTPHKDHIHISIRQ
jgi:hypothetical protein